MRSIVVGSFRFSFHRRLKRRCRWSRRGLRLRLLAHVMSNRTGGRIAERLGISPFVICSNVCAATSVSERVCETGCLLVAISLAIDGLKGYLKTLMRAPPRPPPF